jgi:hypothetical protein
VADVLWTQPRLDARELPVHLYRDELGELCRRHGVSPREVGWIEHDVIDMPLLRIGLYLRDDQGRLRMADDGQHAAMTTVERALIGDLPDWWRPAA